MTAHSSGNHAQAVAYAAKALGIKATIVMPNDAPAGQAGEGTLRWGAEIVTVGAGTSAERADQGPTNRRRSAARR